MAHPILVHPSPKPPTFGSSPTGRNPSLPPISAFSFDSILRAADGPDLQAAIDGITEICAKNRMSLAEEYASHKPPVGEITGGGDSVNQGGVGTRGSSASGGTAVLPMRVSQVSKPPVRRALTSVPEASSSGSEGSGRGRKRRGSLFGFVAPVKKMETKTGTMRVIRIGSMGRTVSAGCTTALSGTTLDAPMLGMPGDSVLSSRTRATSAASTSLQRLLEAQSPPAIDGD